MIGGDPQHCAIVGIDAATIFLAHRVSCKSEGHPYAAQAEAKGLIEDESQHKARRRVDKFMTLQVQQISATQQQASY